MSLIRKKDLTENYTRPDNIKKEITMEVFDDEKVAYKRFLLKVIDTIAFLIFMAIVAYSLSVLLEKDRTIMDFLKIIGITATIISIWLVLIINGLIHTIFFFLTAWFVYDTIASDQSNMWMLGMPILFFLWLASYYVEKRILKQ